MKVLALVAHDNMKRDLAEWVDWNCAKLSAHHLVCTGTTGKMVERTLRDHHRDEEPNALPHPELRITLLKSGPLGGDQQLGSLIADGRIDALIFFWDPMSAQPHDVDVKALLRLATLYNVPTAVNRSTADFLISSPLFEDESYKPVVKDDKAYIERVLKKLRGPDPGDEKNGIASSGAVFFMGRPVVTGRARAGRARPPRGRSLPTVRR